MTRDRSAELIAVSSQTYADLEAAAGHDDTGFIGAVLTICLGTLLARFDDDLAAAMVQMHWHRAMQYRDMLRSPPPDGKTH